MLEECTLYAKYKEISIYRHEIHQKDWDAVPPVKVEDKVLVYYKDHLIWKTYMGGEKLYSLPTKIRNYYPLIEKVLKYSFLYRDREKEIPENFLEDFFNLIEEKECEIFDYFLKKGKVEKEDDVRTEGNTEEIVSIQKEDNSNHRKRKPFKR